MTIKLERLSDRDITTVKEQKVKTETESGAEIIVKKDMEDKEGSEGKVEEMVEKKEDLNQEDLNQEDLNQEDLNQEDSAVKTEPKEDTEASGEMKTESRMDSLEPSKSEEVCEEKINTDAVLKEEKADGERKKDKVAPDKCESESESVDKEKLETDEKHTESSAKDDDSVSSETKQTEGTTSETAEQSGDATNTDKVDETTDPSDKSGAKSNTSELCNSVSMDTKSESGTVKELTKNEDDKGNSEAVEPDKTGSPKSKDDEKSEDKDGSDEAHSEDTNKTSTNHSVDKTDIADAETKENCLNVDNGDGEQAEKKSEGPVEENCITDDDIVEKNLISKETKGSDADTSTSVKDQDNQNDCNSGDKPKKTTLSKTNESSETKDDISDEASANKDVEENQSSGKDTGTNKGNSVHVQVEADVNSVDKKDSSGKEQTDVSKSCDDGQEESKTDDKKDTTETVTNSKTRPGKKRNARTSKVDELTANEFFLPRTRRSTRRSSSLKEKVNENGISENQPAETEVGDGLKEGEKEEELVKGNTDTKDMNGKEDTDDEDTEEESVKPPAKETKPLKVKKPGTKRSAAEVEYKEPAEKRARRGRGAKRVGMTRVRAKRKVAVSEESSDSSDSDDVPLSVIKGQEKSVKGAVANKSRYRKPVPKNSSEVLSAHKKGMKSKVGI